MSKRKLDSNTSETALAKSQPPFEVKITDASPLADYIQLIRQHVQSETIMADDVLKDNFQRIASGAREVIWKLLFGDASSKGEGDGAVATTHQPTAEQLNNAAELLEEHKCDACFYSPWEYNEWIVTVRDELLKRKMFDFWHDSIVHKELGPCWAKDSDLFDDMEDPAPAAFYAHAGCVAPFAKEAEAVAGDTEANSEATVANAAEQAATGSPLVVAAAAESTTSPAASAADDASYAAKFDAKISTTDSLVDYRDLMHQYVHCEEIVSDDELSENYKRIATAARATIWKLLFASHDPLETDLINAEALLEEHKDDACSHGPYDYNDWIVLVRDELLKRKMLDFWRNVIVKKELGPCWAKDSDYFDDLEDPEPAAFYAHAGCVAPFAEPTSDDDDDVDDDDDHATTDVVKAAADTQSSTK